MQEIEKYLSETIFSKYFLRYAQENVNKILIGNKCDMGDKRKVNFEEGSELVKIPKNK